MSSVFNVMSLNAYGAVPKTGVPQVTGNRLLDALPAEEAARWREHLETVQLRSGQVLASSSATAAYVYFPIDCLVSLVYLTEEGSTTEIALIGNEGLVGMSLFMGEAAGASQALVQCTGSAYRMKASLLKEYFNKSEAARGLLLRYMQALMAQSAQLTVCNRHHSVEQQLCRWLLSALDRQPTNELTLTQESIANTLGVRRAGVTEAASKLRKLKILECRRGRIAVLDRAALEHRACECYTAMSREHRRLAPAAPLQRLLPSASGLSLLPQQQAPALGNPLHAANDFGARAGAKLDRVTA